MKAAAVRVLPVPVAISIKELGASAVRNLGRERLDALHLIVPVYDPAIDWERWRCRGWTARAAIRRSRSPWE